MFPKEVCEMTFWIKRVLSNQDPNKIFFKNKKTKINLEKPNVSICRYVCIHIFKTVLFLLME